MAAMVLAVETFHYVGQAIVMTKRKSNFEDKQKSLYIKFGNVSHKFFINDLFVSPDKKGIKISYKYYRPGTTKNVTEIMAPFNQHAADEYFAAEKKDQFLQEDDSYAGLILRVHIGCDWFYGGLYQRNKCLAGYDIEMRSLEGDYFSIVDNGYMDKYKVRAISTYEELIQMLKAIDYALNSSIVKLCRKKAITKKAQYYEPPPRQEEKFKYVSKKLLEQQEKRLAPVASYTYYGLDFDDDSFIIGNVELDMADGSDI